MKKLILFMLSVFVLAASGLLHATSTLSPSTLLPAMVVTLTNGNQHVVLLEGTAVSDLSVFQQDAGMDIAIPEEEVSGVRSLVFAMVVQPNDPAAVEDNLVPSAHAIAEKVLIDGKVYVRIQMPEGHAMYYDITGKSVKTSIH